jgi:putative sterol carrier protein
MTVTTATDRFFDTIKQRGHEPLLERATGSVRFDLHSGREVRHWLVGIEHGDTSVSRRNGRADTVVQADAGLFDRIVTGEANVMASILRGLVGVEGDPQLAVLIQRLFARASADVLLPAEAAA